MGYSPRSRKESERTEWLTLSLSLSQLPALGSLEPKNSPPDCLKSRTKRKQPK